MNNRLTQFLAAEQLTPTRFADLIGVQRSGISHILSGRNKPGYDFFEKFIKRFPAVNLDWLISGQGKMYKEMNTPYLFPIPPPEIPVEVPNLFSESIERKEPVDSYPILVDKQPEKGKKTVEKVIVFYSDKTFLAYVPE